MNDFGNRLNLKVLQEISTQDNIHLEGTINEFLFDIYFRIFEYTAQKGLTIKAFEIQSEYYGDGCLFSISDYDKNKISSWNKIIDVLRLDSEITIESKNDQYILTNYLLEEHKKMLSDELNKYRTEDLIVLIYSIATALSKISVLSVGLYKHKAKDIDKEKKARDISNLIIDTIALIYETDNSWIMNLLGSTKKACEYLINTILSSELNGKLTLKDRIDIKKMFYMSESIVEVITTINSIESLSKMNYKMKLKNGMFDLDDEFHDKTADYLNNNIDDTLDIDSENARKLLAEFEDIEGYSPFQIEKYVMDFNSRHLKFDASINLVEDKFIYFDFLQSTGFGYDVINKVFSALSMDSISNLEKSIFSQDNRLFRTPIVKVDNYFLLSNQLLYEASSYFRYRILKADLSNDKNFRNKLKQNYDEHELSDLLEVLKNNNIFGGANLHLEQFKPLTSFLCDRGISKELDFYFVYKNVLYTMEYKNQRIDNSIYDICKSYSRNIKHKSKHVRLVDILRENKDILSNELGIEICDIRSFLVFKKKNSFSEFYTGKDIYVCSYSQFLEFCIALFKYGDFEMVSDGLTFFI